MYERKTETDRQTQRQRDRERLRRIYWLLVPQLHPIYYFKGPWAEFIVFTSRKIFVLTFLSILVKGIVRDAEKKLWLTMIQGPLIK